MAPKQRQPVMARPRAPSFQQHYTVPMPAQIDMSLVSLTTADKVPSSVPVIRVSASAEAPPQYTSPAAAPAARPPLVASHSPKIATKPAPAVPARPSHFKLPAAPSFEPAYRTTANSNSSNSNAHYMSIPHDTSGLSLAFAGTNIRTAIPVPGHGHLPAASIDLETLLAGHTYHPIMHPFHHDHLGPSSPTTFLSPNTGAATARALQRSRSAPSAGYILGYEGQLGGLKEEFLFQGQPNTLEDLEKELLNSPPGIPERQFQWDVEGET